MNPTAVDMSALEGAPLLEGLTPEILRTSLADARVQELRAGERLPAPERGGEAVYVVLAGALGVFADANARLPLAVIEPGGCAGEQAVLGDPPFPQPVMAVEPTRLAVFAVEALLQAMQREPRIAYNLLRVLARRVRADDQAHPGLEATASTDRLTGLHNRRWMQEMFERELSRIGRSGQRATLLMIDIDGLGQINESVGRPGGDRLLARVGELLQRALRPSDMCVRYGGGKFCVLLPEADANEARAGAVRVCHRIAQQPVALSRDLQISCTVSVGVAEWRAGQSLEELLRTADSALQAAKEVGGNRAEVAAGSAAR